MNVRVHTRCDIILGAKIFLDDARESFHRMVQQSGRSFLLLAGSCMKDGFCSSRRQFLLPGTRRTSFVRSCQQFLKKICHLLNHGIENIKDEITED